MKKNKGRDKILAFGIILCMLLALSSVPTSAEIVDSGTCGDNLTWTLDDSGTLTISGTGDMEDYTYDFPAPWYSFRNTITDVIIGDNAESVGGLCFFWVL